MKDRPARPRFELGEGDEYRICTFKDGDHIYRRIPRAPSWWDGADDQRKKSVLDYFDTDDVFTLIFEVAMFMAVESPTAELVARLVRGQWALHWFTEVAALMDDPFTEEHIILQKAAGSHRMASVTRNGATASWFVLRTLPQTMSDNAALLALNDPFDVIELAN